MFGYYNSLSAEVYDIDKLAVYEILDIAALEGNYTPFIQFIADYEKQELQRYIELIEAHDKTK